MLSTQSWCQQTLTPLYNHNALSDGVTWFYFNIQAVYQNQTSHCRLMVFFQINKNDFLFVWCVGKSQLLSASWKTSFGLKWFTHWSAKWLICSIQRPAIRHPFRWIRIEAWSCSFTSLFSQNKSSVRADLVSACLQAGVCFGLLPVPLVEGGRNQWPH